MKNEHNPASVFGKSLGSYIKTDELSHQQNIKDFKKLCKTILETLNTFKGVSDGFERAEFRLEQPFSDIRIMISSTYIRLDFEKKDNRILYFNEEKYDDFLKEDQWWILKVLLNNKGEFLKSIFFKTKRAISYANTKCVKRELKQMEVLFTSKTFVPLIKEFLPKLGSVLFDPVKFGMIRFHGDFKIPITPVIDESFFSNIFKENPVESVINFNIISGRDRNRYEFEMFYGTFVLYGYITNFAGCSESYEYKIYDVYHGVKEKVLLYSYKHNGDIFLNTKDGPQEYRLAAILPLIEVYDKIKYHIDNKK